MHHIGCPLCICRRKGFERFRIGFRNLEFLRNSACVQGSRLQDGNPLKHIKRDGIKRTFPIQNIRNRFPESEPYIHRSDILARNGVIFQSRALDCILSVFFVQALKFGSRQAVKGLVLPKHIAVGKKIDDTLHSVLFPEERKCTRALDKVIFIVGWNTQHTIFQRPKINFIFRDSRIVEQIHQFDAIRQNSVCQDFFVASFDRFQALQLLIRQIAVSLNNRIWDGEINTENFIVFLNTSRIVCLRVISHRVQFQLHRIELDRIHPKGGESRGVAPLVVARKGERAAEFVVGCVAVALAEDFHARKFVSPHGFVQALRDVSGILDFYLVKNIFIA